MKNETSQILKETEILLGLVLSKEHETLPESEARILIEKHINGKIVKKSHNFLVASIPTKSELDTQNIKNTLKRLAYTKQIIHILSETNNVEDLYSEILKGQTKPESIFLDKNKKLTFKANSLNLEHEKRNFLDILEFAKNLSIYPNIGNAKMKDPDANFYVIKSKTIYFGVQIWMNDENFLERRGHKRPSNHPTTMSPKLARALINLSGAKTEVLDPFCGAGGILIESGLMGLKSTGIDLDLEMTIRAKLNLEHFKLKNFEIFNQDALSWTKKIEVVVTDIPYGKSSKLCQDLKELVVDFVKKYEKLTKRMILVHPNRIHVNKLIRNTNWKISEQHEIYVHRSLTRVVSILNI